MTTVGLFCSRVRNSAVVLAALGIVVFVATLALGVTLVSVQNGVTAGSREVLDSAAPRSAAVRVTTHLADDDAKQSAAAGGMFDRLFPAGTVEVHSAQRSLPVDVLDGDRDGAVGGAVGGASAVFGVEPDLLDYATIVDGDWPAGGVAGGAAIQQDAAVALGLAVGDDFSVGDAADPLPLTVAALWRADDPAAPTWFAESAVASGHDGDALGVVVVAQETFRALPAQLFRSWTVTATHDALDDAARESVAEGLDRLHDSVEATPDVVDISSSTEGSLAATLDRIAAAARGASAIATSALVIVALLAVVALVQLCSVLAGSRRQQSDLTRARGLSLSQLAALTVAEAVVVSLPAAALGALTTALALGHSQPAALIAVAAAMVVATAVCLVVVVLFDARPGAHDPAATRSPAAFLIGGGLIAAAAALATVQLYNRGPVAGVDVVAATSPALTLVAAAVLGTALLYPVSAALARGAARSRGVGAVLATRQLARQVARYLVPSLALAVAVASAVFATGLATTWASTERSAQFAGVGSDVSVGLSTDGAGAITALPIAGLEGVDAATALVLASVGLGADRVPFVGLRPESARRVLAQDGDDFATALETTTPDDTGLALPADASGITADVQFTGDGSAPTSTFDIGVWAADVDGALSRVSLTEAGPDWTAPLPEGTGPWTLLAVESVRTGKADPAAASVTVSRIAGDDTTNVTLDLGESLPRAVAPIVDTGAAGEGGGDDDEPLPVVITAALASRVGLAVGDPLTFDFEPTGKTIDAVVSAVTPRVAGVSSRLAVATDLAALDAVTLRPGSAPAEANEVWIATDDAEAVSREVTRTATTTAVIATRDSTSSEPVLADALTAFWLAAGAAALLALVAVGAFFTDDFSGRRPTIAVLRALGFSPREQAAMRGREQLVTIVFSMLVGAVAGAAATALTVGAFVASAAPGSAAFVGIVPAFDPVPWLAFCAALALLALATCGALLAAVRKTAATAVDGGAS